MKFLALDDNDGITECEVTTDLGDFLKFVDSIDSVKEFIDAIREDAKFVLAVNSLIDKKLVESDPPYDVAEETALANESLETADLFEAKAKELGLL